MKISGILTLFVVFIVVALIAGDAMGKRDPVQTARVDTVHIRDAARAAIHDTVTVYTPRVDTVKLASDALDSAVSIVNDSTVHIKESPDSIYVPPILIADIRALRVTVATQDTLIGVLRRQTEADSLRIAARDKVIAHPKPESPWGLGATCGVDPFNTSGPRCTFGVTYRAKIRLPFVR